jgi:hypothetical protein
MAVMRFICCQVKKEVAGLAWSDRLNLAMTKESTARHLSAIINLQSAITYCSHASSIKPTVAAPERHGIDIPKHGPHCDALRSPRIPSRIGLCGEIVRGKEAKR